MFFFISKMYTINVVIKMQKYHDAYLLTKLFYYFSLKFHSIVKNSEIKKPNKNSLARRNLIINVYKMLTQMF